MGISIEIRALRGLSASTASTPKPTIIFWPQRIRNIGSVGLGIGASDARAAPRIFCRSSNCQSAAEGDL